MTRSSARIFGATVRLVALAGILLVALLVTGSGYEAQAGIQRGRQVLLNGPCSGTIQLKIARADGSAEVAEGLVGECVTIRGAFVIGSSASYCTTSGLWSGPMVEGTGTCN